MNKLDYKYNDENIFINQRSIRATLRFREYYENKLLILCQKGYCMGIRPI